MPFPRPSSIPMAIFIGATLFACTTIKKIDQLGIAERVTQLRNPAMVYGFDDRLRRDRYVHNLRGMWLAASIGNSTAARLEVKKTEPPFFTDKDWGKVAVYVLRDPWLSDDDTDLEYLYLTAMHEAQTALLTQEMLASAWPAGVVGEKLLPVSAVEFSRLTGKGLKSPATGLAAFNPGALDNGAQLSTEIFGALAPGMPDYGLRLADLPIRAVASGYAVHAAQFNVVMYSLASVVKKGMTGREKVLWLSREARKYIPDTSKIGEIFDFVLAEFLQRCPDAKAKSCGAWEETRDALDARFRSHGRDAAVNFGAGAIALLYGQGNLKRTIQIAALVGWDADSVAATTAGLLGLMNGQDWVTAQFPKSKLSDRYSVYRSRSRALTDYLPGEPRAEDSFLMMAIRMTPLVEESVKNGGGSIRELNYTVPKLPESDQILLSPTEKIQRASANLRVRWNGGEVAAFSSQTEVEGASRVGVIADGIEHDFSGAASQAPVHEYAVLGESVELGVEYDRNVPIKRVRLITGMTGAFRELKPSVLVGVDWVELPEGTKVSQSLVETPGQIMDWILPEVRTVRGIRLQGVTRDGSASILELDAWSE